MAVSRNEDNTKKGLQILEESLSEMPLNMRLFSLSMRSLYADKAVGGGSQAAVDFRKLRDNTRDDAMVYLKGVLPVATKFVSNISEFFEFYTALSYEEWCDMLKDIQQEITCYKGLAEVLVQMHEDILVPLKKREDEATVIVKSLQNLQEEYDKKRKELESTAGTKKGWAIGLSFVPFIGAIASPLLAASASTDLAEAVAKGEECLIQERAAIAIKECLVPALKNFIGGLEAAAGFFSVMESELAKFEGKANKALENKLMLHYKVMKKEAEKMDGLCMKFHAVLPAVRTDFHAIPTTGTDKSYVDKWLEEQKKVIKSKLKDKAVGVLKAIKDYDPPSEK
ncbi:uncharacterized protein LOC129265838 [Lytechinus pictus]|uniref:uncharacterized protein LOC129265838 n=1 Tax=Lytechinus pictus TaxID=7653 RepID=UPI0030B9E683